MKNIIDKFGMRFCSWLALGLWIGWAPPARAQERTQAFRLLPGWNAAYLDVEAADRRPEAVFAGLEVESVWTYAPRQSVVDFISDPSQPMADRNQWLRWFPTNRVEARFNTLHAIVPNRAYLIKRPAAPADAGALLRVTGQPAPSSRTWAANAYTLRGVPADNAQPPTFAQFFENSPAHLRNGQLQPMYQLGQDGRWSLVAPTDLVERAKAYWIYTRGASDFAGSLTLSGPGAAGLDFGRGVTSLNLAVSVLGTADRVVRFFSDALPVPPLYLRQAGAAEADTQYAPFQSAFEAKVTPAQPLNLQFEADRAAMDTPVHGSVYTLRDGAGTLLYLPIRIER